MAWTVKKQYSFDDAHRLVNGYPDKCKHVHGHTWKVRISARSEQLDEFGFVVDYSNFKPLKEWIDEHLDHATIISKNDTALMNFLLQQEQRVFIIDENPTSENIAKLLYGIAASLGLKPNTIEIDETCTSSCCYGNN